MTTRIDAAIQNQPLGYATSRPHPQAFRPIRRWDVGVLSVFMFVFSCLSGLYLFNILQWSHGPDFGWYVSFQTKQLVLSEVSGEAQKAGLLVGDRILRVNAVPVSSLQQVRQFCHYTGANTYEVERQGQVLTFVVPIVPLGFGRALLLYGVTWTLGIVFFCMGAVVFFMKPDTRASWAFLLMMFNAGLFISFAINRSFSPAWLDSVFAFASAFLSASLLHLAQTFPTEQRWVQKRPLWMWLPYGLSLGLFVIARTSGTFYIDVPIFWRTIINLLLACSLLVFLATTWFAYRQSDSLIARMRCRVVLIGWAFAIGFPLLYLITTFFLHRPLLPNVVFNLVFLAFFPLSIGYAIVRHNLFDVDVYIKRAVGYATMTVIVGFAYISLETGTRTVILSSLLGDHAEQVSPILFALLVVFLFNPINRKVQDGVDVLFFRKQFDYKQTILSVTNTLTSVLDLDLIIQQILQTVKNEMFIDTVGLGVLEPHSREYHLVVVSDAPDNGKGQVSDARTLRDDPLLALLSREKRMITTYDIEEDPRYDEVQAPCVQSFTNLNASMVIPLIYQGEITGVLTLGQKKSGYFYTREDIELLMTLANEGAVAIENAKLFKEYLEKTRLDEELKIAHTIQVSMLPDKAPELEGIQIAARSIPARQVGGDFYDFIEVQEDGAGNGARKQLALVIGDVSGKAVSAALLMAASRSIFRVLAESHASVEEVMTRGNQRLNRDIKKGTFVALLYAVVDPEHKTLTLSNAGQTQPILCPGDRSQPAYIDTAGDKFPLGIVKQCQYQETCLSLKSGDAIVFYTDGIVEALNEDEEMYGFERLMAVIAQGRDLNAPLLLDSLLGDVSRFVGNAEQHDDLTMVVLKAD